MLRFEYPVHLYALLLVPLLLLFFWAAWTARRRAIRRFGSHRLMQQLMPHVSRYRYYLKFALLLFTIIFLAVAWANPQYGTKLRTYEQKSVEVIFAFDLSESMLARDVTPNRLERARRFAQKLAEGLRSERLGLVIFAGSAYLQSPITIDYSAIVLALRSLDPYMVSDQGTRISQAIRRSVASFSEDNKSHKVLIIITDGENHEAAAIEEAREAAEEGLITFTVGVGTREGGFIPVVINGEQAYKIDRAGQPIRSRLNEEVLQQIAQAGDGRYFNLAAGSETVLQALSERIDQMEKRSFEERSYSDYASSFQWFIGLALLLLLLDFLLPYRKTGGANAGQLFDQN
mgnify:CR=1 FL=1